MRLRIAVPNDAAALAEIYRPVVADTAISFETQAPEPAQMRLRVQATLQVGLPWLVIEDGAVLGYAYAGPHRKRAAYAWTVETSIYLAKHARGRGLGTQLGRALSQILTRQGYRTALAGVTLPNAPSLRLHERLGYRSIGVFKNVGYKFGQSWDVWWGQQCLRASTPPNAPQSLRPSHLDGILQR